MTKRPASHPRNQASAGTPAHADSAAEARGLKLEQDSVTAPAADDDDSFDDVPTVANRAKPTAGEAAPAAIPAERTPGIGAYRLVRPATSDTLAVPRAPEKSTRLVIGTARK